MKRKPRSEFNAFHLFVGLLLGFLLGSTLVYWHSDRQNDRLISEAFDKIMAMFESHTIHLDSGDSIIVIRETGSQMQNQKPESRPGSISIGNDYFIAQDKLLFARTISLTKADSVSAISRKFDSLLGGNNQPNTRQSMVIEFWESPLNSVGYKMRKNKLVLYGIQTFDQVNIVEHKGKLYMNYSNEYYLLELTTQFKPLIPINDPQLALDMIFSENGY